MIACSNYAQLWVHVAVGVYKLYSILIFRDEPILPAKFLEK